MPHEMLVALDVADPTRYQQYRTALQPLLTAAGGGFRYDFEVARTLRSEAPHPINRVFTIFFRDRRARDEMFAAPAYARIKAELFAQAVRATTIVAEYDR